MQQHVKILGWAFLIYSGILLLLAAFLFVIIGGAGVASVGTLVAILFTILALPALITGFGLLEWVLLNADTIPLFESRATSA